MTKTKQNYEFQSEVKQLLNILVHSLYKDRDIFLRELISNAVDALNKIQFKALTEKGIDPDLELKIDISINQTQKKIIIEDTGIGMTKQEIIKNIGTIAHSGTGDFLKKFSNIDNEQKNQLIGQFGVGFYSSFIVAKEIHLYSKSYQKNKKPYLWISKGDNSFTLEEAVKKTRGTRIELFLRDDAKEFLEKYQIENIISKHSKFLPFPLYLEKKKFDTTSAIWSQPKTSLTKKNYQDFYQSINLGKEEPETYLHLSSDAPVQFHSILYIPKTSMETMGFIKETPGVDLYCRKVLIQKGNKDIFPEYLRFVKGVIDSEEIPLNISRETVQNNIKIRKIRKYLLKKFFSHLENIKNKDLEKYLKIWNNFNKNFKEGIIKDFDSRVKISDLLLFHSSKKGDKYTDLAEYIKSMKKDQKEIYYVSGHDIESLKSNPALEAFLKKDLEVLFLIDPIDEFVLENLGEYKEKKFKSIEAADIKVDQDKKVNKETIKQANNLITYLKTVYKDQVQDIKISDRLIDNPCMLSHPGNGPSIQMEKIMKMSNKDFNFSKRTLEINPNHGLIKEMIRIQEKNPNSEKLKSIAFQMLDNMLLREGILENTDQMITRVQNIMLDASKKY